MRSNVLMQAIRCGICVFFFFLDPLYFVNSNTARKTQGFLVVLKHTFKSHVDLRQSEIEKIILSSSILKKRIRQNHQFLYSVFPPQDAIRSSRQDVYLGSTGAVLKTDLVCVALTL